jgi:hypothetical protein
MDIPSNFSQEQKQKVLEHWNLLLANEKKSNGVMDAGLTVVSLVGLVGGLILVPTGVISIIKSIKL